mmetsp:Transcript_25270/g.42118  ORF Transcript_25270/g.42118 Transcript_25270/m.42118 type:complete len:346 (-) Transcript_25270:142-1179(-)
MYYPDTNASIKLSGSPSLVMNNLSASPMDYMCYVRLDEVYITKGNGESNKIPISKSKVYQATFIQLQEKCVLAVLSNLGIQVWSMLGDNMIFYFPLNSLLGFESEEELFMRGVTCLDNNLCVGCSTGNILIFTAKDGTQACSTNFPLAHNLEADRVAITCLASAKNLLFAADDNGKLFGYAANEAFAQSFSFPGKGMPCTSLCLSSGGRGGGKAESGNDLLLLAGYTSGHIRGFRIDIMEMAFEITAHTRSVTGLCLRPPVGVAGAAADVDVDQDVVELASCAQDQYLHVWALPDYRSASSSRVSLLYSVCLENNMCTGVAYLSEDRICVASYDEDEIALFRKVG